MNNTKPSKFIRFCKFMCVGMLSASILWGPFGMVAGFFPVLMNSLLLTVLLEFDIV